MISDVCDNAGVAGEALQDDVCYVLAAAQVGRLGRQSACTDKPIYTIWSKKSELPVLPEQGVLGVPYSLLRVSPCSPHLAPPEKYQRFKAVPTVTA